MPRAVDLRRVAEWTGTTIDEIQALNPELRRWTTPVTTPNYELKVPAGTARRSRAAWRLHRPTELASLKWYTVRRGETLATIARKLSVSRTDLAEANNLSIVPPVRAGQELIIPRAPTGLLAASAVRSGARCGARHGRSARRRRCHRPDVSASATLMYRVKRGDTLSSIARLFDTTVAKIRSWNRLNGNHIAPGDRLKILASR